MAGYPTRRTFYEFISRFKILAPEAVKGKYVYYSIFSPYYDDSCSNRQVMISIHFACLQRFGKGSLLKDFGKDGASRISGYHKDHPCSVWIMLTIYDTWNCSTHPSKKRSQKNMAQQLSKLQIQLVDLLSLFALGN